MAERSVLAPALRRAATVVAFGLGISGPLLLGSEAGAECGPPAPVVRTASAEGLHPAGAILFQAPFHDLARTRDELVHAVTRAKPQLVYGEERIPLSVRGYRGGSLEQWVLAPARKLRDEVSYQLVLAEPGEAPWPRSLRGEWTVLSEEPAPPHWNATPKLLGTAYDDSFACDATTRVDISVPTSSVDFLGVEVTLTALSGCGTLVNGEWPEELTGPVVLPVVDGKVNLGHKACHPGLDLAWSRRFRARLQLLDVSGRPADKPRDVEFDSPHPPRLVLRSRPHVAPERRGDVPFDLEVALALPASPGSGELEAYGEILGHRLRSLGVEVVSMRAEGGRLRLSVRAAPDAPSWLPFTLRPGRLAIALVADKQSKSDGIVRIAAEGPSARIFESSRPAAPERFETVTTGEAWDIDRTELVTAEPRDYPTFMGEEESAVELRLAREGAERLAQKAGRRFIAVLLDGLVVGITASVRLPPTHLDLRLGSSILPPPDIAAAIVLHPLLMPLELSSLTKGDAASRP